MDFAARPDIRQSHSLRRLHAQRTDIGARDAVTVLFALTGAEIATVAAAESAEPARAVARLTTSVIVRILVFYVLSISLIVRRFPGPRCAPANRHSRWR